MNSFLEKSTNLSFGEMRLIVENISSADLPHELAGTKYQEALYRFIVSTTAEIRKRAHGAWQKINYPAGNILWSEVLDPISSLIVLRNHQNFSQMRTSQARDCLALEILNSHSIPDDSILMMMSQVTCQRKLLPTEIISLYGDYLLNTCPEFVGRVRDMNNPDLAIFDSSSFEKLLFLECAGEENLASLQSMYNLMYLGLWMCPTVVEKHFHLFEKYVTSFNITKLLTAVRIPKENAFVRFIDSATSEVRMNIKYFCAIEIQKQKEQVLPENHWALEYFDLLPPETEDQ